MGLNMNYALLIEDNNAFHKLPDYRRTYTVPFSREYMLETIYEFNQQILEAKTILDYAGSDEAFLNEEFSFSGIWESVKKAVKAVIDAIWNLIKKIGEFFKKIIDKIKQAAANSKDKIKEKYRDHERMQLLKKALASCEDDAQRTVNIASIVPTTDLLDRSFPDTSVLRSDLVKMATDTMNNYCTNLIQKSGDGKAVEDTELKASETFVEWIEGEKNDIIGKIFGKYSVDYEDIAGSSINIAKKAFGDPQDKKDTLITPDLYGQACDNLEKGRMDSILRDTEADFNEATRDFNAVKAEMESVYKSLDHFEKELKFYEDKIDLRERYHSAVKTVTSRINRALNVVRECVYSAYGLIWAKHSRVLDIFAVGGDSYRVKNTAHRLIANYLKLQDDDYPKDEAFNGMAETEDIYQLNENFCVEVALVNEALLEQSFNERLVSVITEADDANDGGNQAAPAQTDANQADNAATQPPANNNQQTQNNDQNNQQNVAQKSGGKILEWLKGIINRLTENIQKFKARIEEFVAKNGPDRIFWERNGENIKKTPFTDTMVNQWYEYNVLDFTKSTYVPFNISSPDLKDDESMQNAIMRKVTNNLPNFAAEDTFSQKMNKIYQGTYINDEQGKGKKLAEIGYKHDVACNFVEGFVTNGFESDALKTITSDFQKISDVYKEVNNNYQSYASQMAANVKVETQTTQTTEPKQEAAVEEFPKFNLAEHFCLVHHEASFTTGQADSAIAAANGGTATQNKELDGMIKRFFQCNITAVTARMTCTVAAYKQYMSLFKHIFGGKQAPEENQENNNQQQQNQEQNNQQQQPAQNNNQNQ